MTRLAHKVLRIASTPCLAIILALCAFPVTSFASDISVASHDEIVVGTTVTVTSASLNDIIIVQASGASGCISNGTDNFYSIQSYSFGGAYSADVFGLTPTTIGSQVIVCSGAAGVFATDYTASAALSYDHVVTHGVNSAAYNFTYAPLNNTWSVVVGGGGQNTFLCSSGCTTRTTGGYARGLQGDSGTDFATWNGTVTQGSADDMALVFFEIDEAGGGGGGGTSTSTWYVASSSTVEIFENLSWHAVLIFFTGIIGTVWIFRFFM